MKSFLDIDYVGNGNKSQMLDIHVPEKESFPVFIYFHGGGIEHGDKCGDTAFRTYLADHGVCVVSANYRMYPENSYPDFLEDSAAAVAWVFKNIENYGKSEGIYVGGSSAGGYISMMLCFDRKYLGKHEITPMDISGFVHDAGQPTAHFNVLKYKGIDPRRVIIDETAPLYHIGTDKEYPRMLFIVSDNDMQNRYEQTMLTLSTLKHFGHKEKTALKLMNGKHCAYVKTEIFGEIIFDFIKG
jgi:hypothetical protein